MPDAQPTPNPSITVGTQVRLTGVVSGPNRKSDGAIGVCVDVTTKGDHFKFVLAMPSDLEVIRQSFKRGEVVYLAESSADAPMIVVDDEGAGKVRLVGSNVGDRVTQQPSKDFERRP